jgi:TPP-dependent pyruvate/acetoin dehydrogenase alpha subunit
MPLGQDTFNNATTLLRQMVMIRRFDEMALQLRLSNEIFGPVHPYIGEEAIAVGAISCLENRDKVVSHHRGHGHMLAKGADPARMMAELFGRVGGYCRGKGGSMHIADYASGIIGANGIVGAGLPIGAGVALAERALKKGSVVMVFFGDGATGQGVFHESLNISSLLGLPVVWVCENNEIAVDTPLSSMMAFGSIADFGRGFGIPACCVDGSDVFDVIEAASEAIDRARSGAGPTLLECRAYRWGVHSQGRTTAPDKRDASAASWSRSKDPIARLERWLAETGQLAEPEREILWASVEAELADAVKKARDSDFPSIEEATAHVFKDTV